MRGPECLCHAELMSKTTPPPPSGADAENHSSPAEPPIPAQNYSSPPPPMAPLVVQPMLESEARNWAMLVHILAAVAVVLSAGTLAFVIPLVIWLIYRERSALVDFHGKQNLNLQLTLLATVVVGGLISIVTLGLGLLLMVPLVLLYGLYALVISVVAGVKANAGEYYAIPLAIRFIK